MWAFVNDTLAGSPNYRSVGYSVASGDVNGDGYDDILVGAPIAAEDTGLPSSAYTGRALLFRGSATGLEEEPHQIFRAEDPGTAYGAAVAFAGDINGDGSDDLLIGEPCATQDGIPGIGAVHVYYGAMAKGPGILLAGDVVGVTAEVVVFNVGFEIETWVPQVMLNESDPALVEHKCTLDWGGRSDGRG